MNIQLKTLCSILDEHGINIRYENKNLIVVNGITVVIKNDLASFGTCRLRIRDCYGLLTGLQHEGLIDFPHGDKARIVKIYEIEVMKSNYAEQLR